VISRWNSAVILFGVLSFLLVFPVAGVCASAQGTQTYRIGASVGDSAWYTVNEAINSGLQNGDTLKFVVNNIETVNVVPENSSRVLSYEQANCTGSDITGSEISVNPATRRRNLALIFPIYFAPNGSSYYGLLCPFLPTGPGFFEALSGFFPSLNVSISGGQEVLTTDFYERSVISENLTFHWHYMMAVEPSLGIMTKYEVSGLANYASNLTGSSYTIMEGLVSLSLANASIASMLPSGVVKLLVILAPALLTSLVVAAYLLDARRMKRERVPGEGKTRKLRNERGSEGEETAKGKLLKGLSNETLLKIAESVSQEVGVGTKREILIKAIKSSLSVEEIEKLAKLG
jgi:hypothetical protein